MCACVNACVSACVRARVQPHAGKCNHGVLKPRTSMTKEWRKTVSQCDHLIHDIVPCFQFGLFSSLSLLFWMNFDSLQHGKRQLQVLIQETNNRDLNWTRRDFLPSRCQGQSRRSGRSKGCWSETRWSCCKNGLVRTPESTFFPLFYWQRKITKKHL